MYERLSQLGRDLRPANLRTEARRIVEKQTRRLRKVDRQVVHLAPARGVKPRGRVLFSYILDPFVAAKRASGASTARDLSAVGDRLPTTHTHFWESWTMARAFVERGFAVDAVSWANGSFEPDGAYDLVLDVRQNLERWAKSQPGALKVLHCDTAHWSFHNPAQRLRLAALAARRGEALESHKMLPESQGIQAADCALALGDGFTQSTYAFAGKPVLHVPMSVPFVYDDLLPRDAERARRRFLWFGSGALVHKGLDLVLEAFAGLPEHHLTVCGPVRRERDFERTYARELYRTRNIHTHGWIDPGSRAFLELASRTGGLLYPSCSEGGGGSVYTCMHAGIVPLVPPEVSVPVSPEWGVHLDDVSVDGLRQAVRDFAARPVCEHIDLADAARAYARAKHDKAGFQRAWGRTVDALLDGSWRDVAPPSPPDPGLPTPCGHPPRPGAFPTVGRSA